MNAHINLRKWEIKIFCAYTKWFRIAVGRCLIAVLENFQNSDGSIDVPTVLQEYMGGRKINTLCTCILTIVFSLLIGLRYFTFIEAG